MTSNEIRERRLELDLTIDEMAFALNLTEDELVRIEAGDSDLQQTKEFQESWERLEERVFATYVGAPLFA